MGSAQLYQIFTARSGTSRERSRGSFSGSSTSAAPLHLRIIAPEITSMKLRRSVLPRIAYLLLTALSCTLPGWTQTVTGRISGRIQDTSGGVLPGTSITISNEGTQLLWKAVADSKGDYVVPNLPPGAYRVTVSHAGFNPASRTDVDLASDARVTADFSMTVGDTTQHVDVIASG